MDVGITVVKMHSPLNTVLPLKRVKFSQYIKATYIAMYTRT